MPVSQTVTIETTCLNCGSPTYNLGGRGGFNIIGCETCNLRVVFPFPATSVISAHYDSVYFEWHTGAKRVEGDVAMAKSRLAFLSDLTEDKTLLDVGCGNGAFLATGNSQGWRSGAVELSVDMLRQASAQCTLGSWGGIDDAEGTFGAVTMWEYIEHVTDPRTHIEQAHRLLATGGILGLSTPNTRAVHGQEAFLSWEQTKPPEHLIYWDDKNLVSFVERWGFDLVGVRYHGFAPTLAIWRHLGRRSNKITPFWPISAFVWTLLRPLWISRPFKKANWRGTIYEGVELYFRKRGA